MNPGPSNPAMSPGPFKHLDSFSKSLSCPHWAQTRRPRVSASQRAGGRRFIFSFHSIESSGCWNLLRTRDTAIPPSPLLGACALILPVCPAWNCVVIFISKICVCTVSTSGSGEGACGFISFSEGPQSFPREHTWLNHCSSP